MSKNRSSTNNENALHQSEDRRRRLHNLLDEGMKLESKITQQSASDTLEAICKIITESDNILKEGDVKDRAECTSELVLDAHVVKMNHELVSKVLQINTDFNDLIYKQAISSIVYKSDTPDWDAIAEIAFPISLNLRIKSTMFGANEVEIQKKPVKQRQQRKKTILAQEIQPDTVESLKQEDQGASRVNIIHKQIVQLIEANDKKPIPFYKVILDPANFMNTVQNAFQISFLVRDNIIAIEKGEDGYPQMRLVTSAERKMDIPEKQAICSLNMDLCDKMAEYYGVTEPMLKVPDDDDSD